MTFGDALSAAMDAAGMDATTLSERSGVSSPYISKVRSGTTLDPSWSKACALITGLGMTPQEFLQLQLKLEASGASR